MAVDSVDDEAELGGEAVLFVVVEDRSGTWTARQPAVPVSFQRLGILDHLLDRVEHNCVAVQVGRAGYTP